MHPLPVAFAMLAQCLDAEPLPACRSFIVTDAHVLARVTPSTGSEACCPEILYTSDLSAEAAWMINLGGGGGAVGVGVFGGREFAIDATQLGVRARYRRWLGRHRAVDVGAGVVLTSVGAGGLTEHAGLTTHAALDLGGWIKLTGGLDWVPGLQYSTDYPPVPVRVSPSVYLGLSLTRTPARLAWAAAGGGGLLAAAVGN